MQSPREIARVFTPKLAALVERPLFSEIWSDRTLGERERSIATIAILIASGSLEELPAHLQRAHDGGMTCSELSALITHTAFYAGFPRRDQWHPGSQQTSLGAANKHPAPVGIENIPGPGVVKSPAPDGTCANAVFHDRTPGNKFFAD